jgi:hypothetical protein
MSRRTLILVVTLLAGTLSVAAGGLVTVGSPLRADSDPKRDARLLYVEGKFRDGDNLLAQAGPDVVNDLELRGQLADAALKFLKNRTGEDRREGLEAVKRNWGAVAAAQPGNGAAISGAVLAAKGIAELDLAAKRPDAARLQATWALELGEKAAAEGLTPETKAALGEAYGLRASTTRKVDQIDQVMGDYRKGAGMLEQASAGHEKESVWLAAAAELRMKEAVFVHDSIPLETEKRDDEALVAAVGLAKRACEAKGAAGDAFVLHIRALCAARDWKVQGDLGQPFMTPLTPPWEKANLLVPKSAGWKRLDKTDEWDVIFERNYHDPANDGAVQIMVTAHPEGEGVGVKTWSDLEEGVKVIYDRRKGGYSDVATDDAPTMLGPKKKGPQLWHFQLAGTVANSSRRNKMAEWFWPSQTKKSVVMNLRIIDWRPTTSIEDPDIVAFVQSAIPPGLWPPGQAAPAEDPKKKPAPKKK